MLYLHYVYSIVTGQSTFNVGELIAHPLTKGYTLYRIYTSLVDKSNLRLGHLNFNAIYLGRYSLGMMVE